MDDLAEAVKAALEAAEGDSNDAEIATLQTALQIALEELGRSDLLETN